ncbi:MAG: phosphopantetheine-binding protein [Chloroflexi bacterium]|nr:phosphopantetheine-binding protein [Chloroflexota bacterium]
MASNEERLLKLVDDNLTVEGRTAGDPLNLDRSIAEAGVPSQDIVAFLKLVNEEFGTSISAGDCGDLLTPRSLLEYLDSNAA